MAEEAEDPLDSGVLVVAGCQLVLALDDLLSCAAM